VAFLSRTALSVAIFVVAVRSANTVSLPPKMSEVADFILRHTHDMLIFSLVIVGASALRLGAPTGAGSALLRTRASSRTCGQPHMGLAVLFPAEALKVLWRER
jgi:hypothetical protein